MAYLFFFSWSFASLLVRVCGNWSHLSISDSKAVKTRQDTKAELLCREYLQEKKTKKDSAEGAEKKNVTKMLEEKSDRHEKLLSGSFQLILGPI